MQHNAPPLAPDTLPQLLELTGPEPSMLARVITNCQLNVQRQTTTFHLVWLPRATGQDVVLHCELGSNTGPDAPACARSMRDMATGLGVPRDVLWFEYSRRRTPDNERILSLLNRDYVLFPVEFGARGRAQGTLTSVPELARRLRLDAPWLDQLCQGRG